MKDLKRCDRILEIFYRAVKGENLSVKKLAEDYEVSTKTISRDIKSLEAFMAERRELLGYATLEYSHRHILIININKPLQIIYNF
ncbi:MAG: helix-turn-helix domain-containing protein [Clostridia bacterium]